MNMKQIAITDMEKLIQKCKDKKNDPKLDLDQRESYGDIQRIAEGVLKILLTLKDGFEWDFETERRMKLASDNAQRFAMKYPGTDKLTPRGEKRLNEQLVGYGDPRISEEVRANMYLTALRIIIGKTDDIDVPLCMHATIVGAELEGKGTICRRCGKPLPEGEGRINDHKVFQRADLKMPICSDCAENNPDEFYKRYKAGVEQLNLIGMEPTGQWRRYMPMDRVSAPTDEDHCRVCGADLSKPGPGRYNDHMVTEAPGPICSDCAVHKPDKYHKEYMKKFGVTH